MMRSIPQAGKSIFMSHDRLLFPSWSSDAVPGQSLAEKRNGCSDLECCVRRSYGCRLPRGTAWIQLRAAAPGAREHVDGGNNQIGRSDIDTKTQTHRQVICPFVALRLSFVMWSDCYDLDGSHLFREVEMSKSKHRRNIAMHKDRQ
jgi:hypothetical protein